MSSKWRSYITLLLYRVLIRAVKLVLSQECWLCRWCKRRRVCEVEFSSPLIVSSSRAWARTHPELPPRVSRTQVQSSSRAQTALQSSAPTHSTEGYKNHLQGNARIIVSVFGCITEQLFSRFALEFAALLKLE